MKVDHRYEAGDFRGCSDENAEAFFRVCMSKKLEKGRILIVAKLVHHLHQFCAAAKKIHS